MQRIVSLNENEQKMKTLAYICQQL